jgi:AAA domain (dynein-related subfamily)
MSPANDEEESSRPPRTGRAGRPGASPLTASQAAVRRWEADALRRSGARQATGAEPAADGAYVPDPEELSRQLEALERERQELAHRREDVAARMATIREQGDRLAERERAIAARETTADMWFQDKRAAATATLEAELNAQREQHAKDLRADRMAVTADIKRQGENLEDLRRELDEQRDTFDAEGENLRQLRVALERREQQLDREAQVRAADIIKQLEDELQVARAESAAHAEMVTRLTAELTDFRSRWAATGVEDPRQILTRLQQVEEKNHDLRDKLAARLDDDTLGRLRWLEQQNRELNEERERLRYEQQELRGAQLADRISNLQVQQLADAQEQFDVIKRGYEMRIAELRGTLDQIVQDGRGDPSDPVFPNCLALDDDPSLQEAGLLEDGEIPDLHRLARDLQGTMWQESERAYELDDVCGVLGGLAMSRLHLLEGPSGIGKTSLPVALAKALGVGCAIIEVQAGWRDRHDLFGHYNTFERRFQEEPFLLALYKAQTPRYRGRPFFIVLDEMNLARPEQYFSVLLSKLELDGQVGHGKTPIKLAPVPGGRKPQWMDESGTGIALPDNVWFAGTANQDESTLEFADKTYNRSYVLELSGRRPDAAGWAQRLKPEPYSARALREAFGQAKTDHGEKTAPVTALLADLAGDLDDVGRIHLDPRIEKQLNAYVPVVVAARGTDGGIDPVALAADQFIASKVLHQLHSRFEVTPEGITKLQESIDFYWPERFGGSVPSRCRRVLADELRRRKA